MLKFLVSLIYLAPLALSAESKITYSDYVDCYYELHQNPSKASYISYETVTSLESVPEGSFRHDIRFFSYEGYYGVNVSDQHKDICESFRGMEGKDTCAYDFKVRAKKSSYSLCYVKKWTGGTETENY